MPPVDPRPSADAPHSRTMSLMDILLVLILIALFGLFAQAVGSDSRGFSGRGG